MEPVFLSGIVGAGSAIIANLISSLLQMHLAAKTRAHELNKENYRANLEHQNACRERTLGDCQRAHVLLSILEREFNRFGITIAWSQELSAIEWDKKFIELCGKADELRMVSAQLDPEVYKSLKNIDDLMENFWGNLRTFLHKVKRGDEVGGTSFEYQEAMNYGKLIRNAICEARPIFEKRMRILAKGIE